MLTEKLNYSQLICALIGGLLILRLSLLFILPIGLHGDEAQYWAWAQKLDWGYFSKPPLISVLIASTTALFGDSEWAIRFSSPILHSLTALMLFITGRQLYDARTGFWAACIYLLIPALWLSSAIISTDVPLLLFWTIALNGWLAFRNRPSWKRALQWGSAIGLGLMAKYAMLFFIATLLLSAFIDPQSRRALITRQALVATLVALLIISPNLIWNFQHQFVTFTHTAANANIAQGIGFHFINLLRFWGSQILVFGPISLGLMLLAIRHGKAQSQNRHLSLFVLVPLFIISLQALLSRANANWAVSAYSAGALLTAHYSLSTLSRTQWLKGGLGAHTLLCLLISLYLFTPTLSDKTNFFLTLKHMRAWPQTLTALEKIYAQKPYQALVVDRRLTYYSLNYYGRELSLPLYMWQAFSYPRNHAELTAALPAMTSEKPILIVSYFGKDVFTSSFKRLEALPDLVINVNNQNVRRLEMWAAYGDRRYSLPEP